MSKPKLSILICHQPDKPERVKFLSRLKQIVWPQLQLDAEMIIHDGIGISIGQKRNELVQDAEGEYLQFIDDDDLVIENYVELQMEGINKGVDCCSLKGIITEDAKNPLIFEHSIKYGAYRTVTDSPIDQVRYERYPNHLNCIRADIAKQFRFPETNHGEDTDWATQIHKSGLLKVEHYIPEVIYFYEFRSNK